jgi:hypothetical protein
LVELRRLLRYIEVNRVIKASRLATLVWEVSQVLENLGMPPIPGIPRDPHTTSDVLGAVDMILECLKGVYDFGHDSWD